MLMLRFKISAVGGLEEQGFNTIPRFGISVDGIVLVGEGNFLEGDLRDVQDWDQVPINPFIILYIFLYQEGWSHVVSM